MQGGHKEGTQKTKDKESPLYCIDGHPPHPKVRVWGMLQKTISSVDISTSTSRGMFARAISSADNSSEAAKVNGEKHSQPIHHQRAVHKLHRGDRWKQE